MKVKLASDEVSFYKKVWDSVIEINGKQVRVGSYDEQDSLFGQYDADQEINEEDKKKLTEEELETLEDNLMDILGSKVGEEWDTDIKESGKQ